MKVLKTNIMSVFIDGIMLVVTNVLLFGYLLPIVGMPVKYIAPVYLGSIIFHLLVHADGYSVRIVFDQEYTQLINYQRILPLPKQWLLLVYIISFVIEALIVSLPLISLGIILLGQKFIFIQPHWLFFACTFLLVYIYRNTLYWIQLCLFIRMANN